MKKSICKRALLVLAITSCCFMMSCANNQNTEDGAPLDGAEQTISDAGGGDAPAEDAAASDLSDLDAAANGTDESKPPAADATPAAADAGAQAKAKAPDAGTEDLEKAMDGAGTPPPDAAASASNTPAPDAAANASNNPPPAGADASAAAANDPTALPPDATASNATPPDATAANAPPATDGAAPPPDAGAASASAPPDAGAPPAAGGEIAPPASGNAVADAAAASAASSKKEKKVAHAPASAPKVKQAPFKKGPTTLNRFYFARKGDTAKSVSQLIYGTADRAKELKRWNKGGFSAGKIVYYASPNQPDDTVMKSFYEERALQPEQYQVRPGDKMTKIAAKKLGSTQSWKEIAVLNGLDKINAISDGQTLAIYTDLKGAAPTPAPTEAPKAPEQVASNNPYQQQLQQQPNQAMPQPPPTNIANDPAHPNQPQAQPIGGEPAVAQNDPNALNQGMPNTPPQAPQGEPPYLKKHRQDNGVNVGKLLQQNAFFIVMGLGISALLMALLAINKRKRNSEDFNEDGFGATAVKKRR